MQNGLVLRSMRRPPCRFLWHGMLAQRVVNMYLPSLLTLWKWVSRMQYGRRLLRLWGWMAALSVPLLCARHRSTPLGTVPMNTRRQSLSCGRGGVLCLAVMCTPMAGSRGLLELVCHCAITARALTALAAFPLPTDTALPVSGSTRAISSRVAWTHRRTGHSGQVTGCAMSQLLVLVTRQHAESHG